VKYEVYLVVGSNVDRERCYPEAIRQITSLGEVLAVSAVYETKPVGMPGADDFFNGALLLATDLEPEELKWRLRKDVEERLGRVRLPGGPVAPRTIDVDIALWDDLVGTIAGRPVPDPDILRYIHVARPLADIAPDLPHPVTGRPLGEIAAGLSRSGPLPRPRPDIILEY
jgi:2-amino-4-hydroxy-6-hydroxymethyldihydropteridine diphosphokinase